MSIAVVNDLTQRNQYTAAGGQTTFAYAFPVFAQTDLVVYVDTALKVLTTDYTVTGVGADGGGNVVFNVGRTVNEIITITRDTPLNRTSDYATNGGLQTVGINDDFDRIVLMAQDAHGRIDRSLQRVITDTNAAIRFDAVTGRIINLADGVDPQDALTVAQLVVAQLSSSPTIANNTVLGNVSGGAAAAIALTATQLRTLLALVAANISDFTEASQDVIGALVIDSTTLDATYNDGGNLFALELQAAYNPVGKHLIPLPAANWSPSTTLGCAALAQFESTTNDVNYKYLAFDGTAQEHACFAFPAPKSWNESTLTARFRSQAASGSGDVIWGIQAQVLSDNDTIDAAWGTGVEVTDNHPNATTMRVSAETGAITCAGTPAEGDLILLRIYRKAADAGDTLNAIDAWLSQVELFLTVNAAHDG